MDDISYLDLKSEFYAEILILFNHELLFDIHGIYKLYCKICKINEKGYKDDILNLLKLEFKTVLLKSQKKRMFNLEFIIQGFLLNIDDNNFSEFFKQILIDISNVNKMVFIIILDQIFVEISLFDYDHYCYLILKLIKIFGFDLIITVIRFKNLAKLGYTDTIFFESNFITRYNKFYDLTEYLLLNHSKKMLKILTMVTNNIILSRIIFKHNNIILITINKFLLEFITKFPKFFMDRHNFLKLYFNCSQLLKLLILNKLKFDLINIDTAYTFFKLSFKNILLLGDNFDNCLYLYFTIIDVIYKKINYITEKILSILDSDSQNNEDILYKLDMINNNNKIICNKFLNLITYALNNDKFNKHVKTDIICKLYNFYKSNMLIEYKNKYLIPSKLHILIIKYLSEVDFINWSSINEIQSIISLSEMIFENIYTLSYYNIDDFLNIDYNNYDDIICYNNYKLNVKVKCKKYTSDDFNLLLIQYIQKINNHIRYVFDNEDEEEDEEETEHNKIRSYEILIKLISNIITTLMIFRTINSKFVFYKLNLVISDMFELGNNIKEQYNKNIYETELIYFIDYYNCIMTPKNFYPYGIDIDMLYNILNTKYHSYDQNYYNFILQALKIRWDHNIKEFENDIISEDLVDPIFSVLITEPILLENNDEIFEKTTMELSVYENKLNPITRESLTLDKVIEYNNDENIKYNLIDLIFRKYNVKINI